MRWQPIISQLKVETRWFVPIFSFVPWTFRLCIVFLDRVWDRFSVWTPKLKWEELIFSSSKIEYLLLFYYVPMILLKWSGRVISGHFMRIGISDIHEVIGALHLHFKFISSIKLHVVFQSVSWAFIPLSDSSGISIRSELWRLGSG